MSVHELEARIEKLSADIARQKEILTDLEKSKSLVQRQLNAVRDPVARLPLELSSEIFVRCLPPFPEPGVQHFPMLFLNICNTWADIALSIPTLWAAIRIASPRAEEFPELLTTWLQRARNRPLSVSLSDTSDDSQGVPPIIWQYASRLKHLELCYDQGEDSDASEEDLFPVNLLGSSNSGPLPLLETLRIRYLPHPYLSEYAGYRGPQILQLLRLAPNLVKCMFDYVQPVYGLGVIDETLVLPNLRRLSFGILQYAVNDESQSDDRILMCLTLPCLESISLSMLEISGGDLLSFLKRSSPPLRELILGCGLNDQFDGLDECLRLVPTLTRLEFWWWPVTLNLEELFAASSSDVLPNLRNLAFRLYLPAADFCFWWETLLRVLTARRTQIQTVRIVCGSEFSSSSQMMANIPVGFRELVAGGMKVYVARDDQPESLVSL
ncbi:hypothetical protein B0H11DRAFT_2270001 [Mycena galericulata]|nr:hypothetical protein B0H11DRAFT_2270001 [Mycena galericulata]